MLLVWLVVFALGGMASAGLTDLLSNRFSVPGAEAQKGADLLEDRFGEGGGNFTLVFEATSGRAGGRDFLRTANRTTRRAAAAVPGAKASPVAYAGRRRTGGRTSLVAYAQISTPYDWTDAEERTDDIREAIGAVPGIETYLSGPPAINHDTEPIYSEDLARGESIALPIALLVMAFMFGTLVAMAVPLVFALVTIPTTLGIVWIFANFMDMPIYVQNMATLIGLAIAIDYSMLIVFRYRAGRPAPDPHRACSVGRIRISFTLTRCGCDTA